MGRHKNNAIIVTTVKGERGPQGFQGPDGQACYEGTGDPNTLNLTLPVYTGDYTTARGTETLYYQDSVTGEVWSATSFNGIVIPNTATLQNWTLTNINVRGAQGDRGATAIDKIDVNLMDGNNMASFTVDTSGTTSIGVATEDICKVNFPGTNLAPDFSTIKVVASIFGLRGTGVIGVYDYSDTFLGGVEINGETPSIHTISGVSFPADPEVLTFKATVIDADVTQEDIEIKVGYISIR